MLHARQRRASLSRCRVGNGIMQTVGMHVIPTESRGYGGLLSMAVPPEIRELMDGPFPIFIARRRRRTARTAYFVLVSPVILGFLTWLTGVSLIPPFLCLGWLWGAILVAALISLWLKWSERKFERSVIDKRYKVCPICGYWLAHLPDRHECPECGLGYNFGQVRAVWERWFRKDIGLWSRKDRSPGEGEV